MSILMRCMMSFALCSSGGTVSTKAMYEGFHLPFEVAQKWAYI